MLPAPARDWPDGIYCHAPDNTDLPLRADGIEHDRVRPIARDASDGALAFDTVGRFGYALLAATGRSGAETPAGGTSTRSTRTGKSVRSRATRPPAAPTRSWSRRREFGTAGGSAFLTIDAGSTGDLLAIDARGNVRTIARLPDGPNPIVVVTRSAERARNARRRAVPDRHRVPQGLLRAGRPVRRLLDAVVVGTELTRRVLDRPSARQRLPGPGHGDRPPGDGRTTSRAPSTSSDGSPAPGRCYPIALSSAAAIESTSPGERRVTWRGVWPVLPTRIVGVALTRSRSANRSNAVDVVVGSRRVALVEEPRDVEAGDARPLWP